MIAAFDIGGTHIRAALSSEPGAIGPIRRVATPTGDFGAFVACLAELSEDADRLAISVAGCCDPLTGRMKVANIPCLDGRTAANDLSQTLDRPVWIGNDADCFALAEALQGAGRDHRSVFGVILGTGVGGGLVIDGKIITGAGGFAGEWGHGPVQDSRPLGREVPRMACGCGQAGCLDAIGSARGIERLHRHLHGVDLSARALLELWQQDNAQATDTIAVWTEIMAGPLAMVLNVIGASIVPVGGGLAQVPALVAALDAAVRARRLWQSPGALLVPAEVPGEPGLIGATLAGWAMDEGVAPC